MASQTTVQWYARCQTCAYRGQPVDNAQQAERDAEEHVRENPGHKTDTVAKT
jgi:hypothetical protein